MAEVVLSDDGATAVEGWGSLRNPGPKATRGRQPGPGGWRWINHPGADAEWIQGIWADNDEPSGVEFRVIEDAVHARTPD